MPTYHKLVRDKIPMIIEATGKSYRTRILENTEYIKELRTKLGEEVEEYLSAKTDDTAVEELADILEILHSLAKVHGKTMEDVEHVRQEKEVKRGGFQKGIFLIDVEDE
ncbi:nucleoside triphosphate pyrophosphohydrolase [Evansella tamaricis]|uniref:Nucleoside triphosphate pyrophosphohydrolase n=1 Tax=Evansella tamaricis TaxID=2069301 RepID=A0ABS6JL60_9BACI|nr:nucleoside triphosphate pyrophosphohydrolase [Evansella tamaricis]MBU9714120.1 nucleoside triphosphate pyrophosphohydrolase [Evansella tamaricis]